MKHLLVTNDFPPKLGGIQTYLWELWRRLPPEDVVVLTTSYPGDADWDADHDLTVDRWPHANLVPGPALVRRVQRLAHQHDVGLVLYDPVSPLATIAHAVGLPYGVVVHGAELVVPASLPGWQLVPRRVLRDARIVVAAGGYPAAEARRAAGRPVPTVAVPPGVDVDRFRPLDAADRAAARQRLGLDDGPLVVSVSRLVPRKGMDVLLQATGRLAASVPGLQVAIAGSGRDRPRLEKLAETFGAPVTFLGAVDDDDLPAVYGCADVFAMLCRDRWLGLEREGFGIVFLEAAACGVPQVAGHSGGSDEAVDHDVTGIVVDAPRSVDDVAEAIGGLLADPDRCRRMGEASRARAVDHFDHDRLAAQLAAALDDLALAPLRSGG